MAVPAFPPSSGLGTPPFQDIAGDNGSIMPAVLPASTPDVYTAKMNVWKKNLPILLDMIVHHSLEWPSYAVCWGNVVDDSASTRNCQTQRLFVSRSTGSQEGPEGVWPGNPNAIEVCDVDLPSRYSMDEKRLVNFSEESKAPSFRTRKRIIHPGEVNRIKVCHQHAEIIASHADSPDVYVWNSETQPHRYIRQDCSPNAADVVLKGHTHCATYALDFSRLEPLLISGGEDAKVCLWSLQDDVTSLSGVSSNASGKVERHLQARMVFSGHTESVEDCCFHPSNPFVLASVSDDYRLMIWDSRASSHPASSLLNVHQCDINCIDWNVLDERLLITGSSDRTVKIIDNRAISSSTGKRSVVHEFRGHSNAVTTVAWSPFDANYFATAAEDGMMLINDMNRASVNPPSVGGRLNPNELPPEVVYSHTGHRAPAVDLDWNPCSRWTVATVSDESAVNVGGGTLQMWRLSDLLTLPPEKAIKDISGFVSEP